MAFKRDRLLVIIITIVIRLDKVGLDWVPLFQVFIVCKGNRKSGSFSLEIFQESIPEKTLFIVTQKILIPVPENEFLCPIPNSIPDSSMVTKALEANLVAFSRLAELFFQFAY